MSDTLHCPRLLERLRSCDCGLHCKSGCIQKKAADEIERLRVALDYAARLDNDRESEIERLRAIIKAADGEDSRA